MVVIRRCVIFKRKEILLLIFLLSLSACNNLTTGDLAQLSSTQMADTPTSTLPSETLTATNTFPPIHTFPSFHMVTETPTASLTFTPTFTPTPTETPTLTPTLTPIPTLGPLRGKVNVERLSCRFGPGVMYLFRFSVYGKINVIGRMEGSSWLLVKATRSAEPCWVNGDYMTIEGDVASMEPKDPHIVLPWSPPEYGYGPLTGVSAVRNGDEVTVFWDPLYLRAGDDSEQFPYVVEAWVCQNGEFVFSPVGSYALAAKVIDERGCYEQSHARVFAAEKHGYTKWVNIPWPPHEDSP